MTNNTTFNFILCAAICLLIYSCKNDSGKVKIQEVTLQDIKQDEKYIKPPPPPPSPPIPPKIDSKESIQKCFKNNGLKYDVTINLFIGDKNILGQVIAEEIDGNNTTIIENFNGTISGNTLYIKFEHKPPVIGSTSEWTDKPWTIKKTGDKETLLIVFNAKNYETNKWENVAYEFNVCN